MGLHELKKLTIWVSSMEFEALQGDINDPRTWLIAHSNEFSAELLLTDILSYLIYLT